MHGFILFKVTAGNPWFRIFVLQESQKGEWEAPDFCDTSARVSFPGWLSGYKTNPFVAHQSIVESWLKNSNDEQKSP